MKIAFLGTAAFIPPPQRGRRWCPRSRSRCRGVWCVLRRESCPACRSPVAFPPPLSKLDTRWVFFYLNFSSTCIFTHREHQDWKGPGRTKEKPVGFFCDPAAGGAAAAPTGEPGNRWFCPRLGCLSAPFHEEPSENRVCSVNRCENTRRFHVQPSLVVFL